MPIWVDFMEDALKDVEMSKRSLPEGMVSVRIDPATGLLAHPDQTDGVFEIFREENVPTEIAIPEEEAIFAQETEGSEGVGVEEELF